MRVLLIQDDYRYEVYPAVAERVEGTLSDVFRTAGFEVGDHLPLWYGIYSGLFGRSKPLVVFACPNWRGSHVQQQIRRADAVVLLLAGEYGHIRALRREARRFHVPITVLFPSRELADHLLEDVRHSQHRRQPLRAGRDNRSKSGRHARAPQPDLGPEFDDVEQIEISSLEDLRERLQEFLWSGRRRARFWRLITAVSSWEFLTGFLLYIAMYTAIMYVGTRYIGFPRARLSDDFYKKALPLVVGAGVAAWGIATAVVMTSLGAKMTATLNLLAGVFAPLGRIKWPWGVQALPSMLVPIDVKADAVHFTVTAPTHIEPGSHTELFVWAHLKEEEAAVLRRGMQALDMSSRSELLERSVGPIDVESQTLLSLLLQVDGIAIANPTSSIVWTGSVGSANFVLSAPKNAVEGVRRCTCFIRANGLEIARIDFLLRVGKERQRARRVPVVHTKYGSAFASYASEDRESVLAYIRGLHKALPTLDVFVDVMTLRSGDNLEEVICERIKQADVFYLFWCRHAASSKWVEKEWRCAYETHGQDFIDPIPLERPDIAPPPRELSAKHFNDPALFFVEHRL